MSSAGQYSADESSAISLHAVRTRCPGSSATKATRGAGRSAASNVRVQYVSMLRITRSMKTSIVAGSVAPRERTLGLVVCARGKTFSRSSSTSRMRLP